MEAEPWCYQFMLTGHGVPGLIYKLRHLRKSFPGASVSASVKWESLFSETQHLSAGRYPMTGHHHIAVMVRRPMTLIKQNYSACKATGPSTHYPLQTLSLGPTFYKLWMQ